MIPPKKEDSPAEKTRVDYRPDTVPNYPRCRKLRNELRKHDNSRDTEKDRNNSSIVEGNCNISRLGLLSDYSDHRK